MKRVLATVLTVGMLFPIAGCVSQKQYDELEQRVAALENDRNNTSTVDSISPTTEIVSNTDASAIDETEESTPEEVAGIYSLDDMSSEEIVNLILTYVATPSEGSTDDDFVARFPDDPYGSFSSGNGGGIDFPSGTYRDTVYASNYIDYVQWYYSYNMDGTIMIDNSNSLISVMVRISEYDKAVAIYEALSEVAYATYGDLQESEDGSHWGLYDFEYSWYDPTVLSLSLVNDEYSITYINYFG